MISLDDYDWMLFDITGYLPGVIYVDTNRLVNGNRSADYPGPPGPEMTGLVLRIAVQPHLKMCPLTLNHRT